MSLSFRESLPALELVGSYTRCEQMPSERKEICFMGRSNSGKSSLLAALAHNSSLVRTSGRPGSTRTINLFSWKQLYLADLPGYGYAAVGGEVRRELSREIHDYLQNRHNLCAGFLLLDCNRSPQKEEEYIRDLFASRHIPLNLLLTKSDRLNQKERAALNKRMASWQKGYNNVLPVSSTSGQNLDFLFNYMLSLGA